MKCHDHNDSDAVSQCCDCGRGLCPQCTNKWSIIICDACNYQRAEKEKKEVIKNIYITIPLFFVGLFFLSNSASFVSRIILGYIFAGLPWGWSALNKITPNVFLFLPIGGWVLYFVIKFMLSLLIGAFALPYKAFKHYKTYEEAKKIQGFIKSNAS